MFTLAFKVDLVFISREGQLFRDNFLKSNYTIYIAINYEYNIKFNWHIKIISDFLQVKKYLRLVQY